MERDQVIGWWADAERRFGATVDDLTDDALGSASLLPGWTRGTVVAHTARNADALGNLLTWARTGEERPMYPSMEAREQGIRETSALEPPALRADLSAACGRFTDAVRAMPEAAWAAPVRTAMGREITADGVPWMRCKEVVFHGVDLDAGVGLHSYPDDLLAAFVDEIVTRWVQRDEVPDVRLVVGDRQWLDGSVTIAADLADLLGFLTGRAPGSAVTTTEGDRPELPFWM